MSSLLTVSGFVIALVAVWYNFYAACPTTTCPISNSTSTCPQHIQLVSSNDGKPFQSSWNAWFHPHRREKTSDASDSRNDSAGIVTPDWNILYHLGGNGPWIEKVTDVVEGGVAAPAGCKVEQIHMVGARC
jgi:acid phosphatase